MSDITFTKETCLEILTKCCIVGQSKGAFAIKDAAHIYKIILDLQKDIETKDGFQTLTRAVILANGKGSYLLEEAALIEKTVEWLRKKSIIITDDPVIPEKNKE